MEITAFAVLFLSSLIGFIAIFFTTFGTLIIFLGAAFFAVVTDFTLINWPTLLFFFALYLFGEVFEFFCTVIGAKKFGASNWAVAGALIGGIVGAVMGLMTFGVGIILGTFLGIFLGAFLVELVVKGDLKQSLKAGAGGVLGRVGDHGKEGGA